MYNPCAGCDFLFIYLCVCVMEACFRSAVTWESVCIIPRSFSLILG